MAIEDRRTPGDFTESDYDRELREKFVGQTNPRTETTEAYQDIRQEGTIAGSFSYLYKDPEVSGAARINPDASQYDVGRGNPLGLPEIGGDSAFKKADGGVSIQEQDLVLPQFYPIVLDFMKAKSGELDWDERDPEEVVDEYVEYWRGVASGNSVALGKHVWNVWNASGDKEKSEIFLAGEELRDSMGNFGGKGFTETSVMEKYKQKMEGTWDYAFNVVADPVNLVSLGMYPIISRTLGRKGAKKLLEQQMKRNLRNIAKDPKIKGPTNKKLAGYLANQRLIRNTLSGNLINGRQGRGNVIKGIVDNATKKAMFRTGAWDSLAAVGVDSLYQHAQSMLDEDYNWSQASTILNATVGGAPSWIGAYFVRLKALKKIDSITARKEEAAIHGDIFNFVLEKAHAARTASQSRIVPADLQAVDMTSFLDDLKDNVQKQTSLREKVEDAALKLFREKGTPIGQPEQSDMMKLLLLGNKEEGVEGVVSLFNKWGINYEGKRTNLVNSKGEKIKDGTTNWLIDTINILPPELRSEINKLYEGSLKRSKGFEDADLDEGFRLIGASFSEGGGQLNIASQVESGLSLKGAWLDPDAKATDIVAQEFQPTNNNLLMRIIKGGAGGFGHAQSQYIKGLVAAPRTSWLNTVGYGGMAAFNSASDIVSLTFDSVLNGGTLAARHLTVDNKPNKKDWADWWNKTYQLTKNSTVNRVKNLGSMGESIDVMMDTFVRYPKQLEKLVNVMTGGTPLDAADMAKYLDLPEVQKLRGTDPRTWLRSAMEKAQLISGARAVDMASKGQAFLYNIDKRMIKKYNMNYIDVLRSEDALKIVNSKEFGTELTAAADDAAREVLGRSFGFSSIQNNSLGSSKPILARIKAHQAAREAGEQIPYVDIYDPFIAIADLIENARKIPIIGTMLPFGRFANGVLSLSMDMTGMSIFYNLTRKSLGGKSRDLTEIAPKTATAWLSAWAMSGQEMDDLDRGLALDQRMDAEGNIVDVQYAYPYVAFKSLARGIAYQRLFGEVPPSFITEAALLMGGGVTRGMSSSYDKMVEFLYDGTTQSNPFVLREAVNHLGGLFGNLFQGYSRVLSPGNDALKLAQGPEYYSPDRNLSERKRVSQTFRYVDEIFDKMGIYEKDPERKFVATDYDEFAFSSPVPFILGAEANVSYIEQIMNQLSVPKYMLTNDTSKYGAVVKSEIDRLISTESNRLAEKLWQSPEYQEASLKKRRNLFDLLRKDAKEVVMGRIANMDTSEELNDSERIFRIKQVKALKEINGKYSTNVIKRRLNELEFINPFIQEPIPENIEERKAWLLKNQVTDIEDMSGEQIETLQAYIEIMKDKVKADYKEATEN